MKKVASIRVLLMALMMVGLNSAFARENKKMERSNSAHQILIIGLNDNVKSNYFYNGMITKETGIPTDSIPSEYNDIIADNIVAADRKGVCLFVAADSNSELGNVINEIKLKGEEEETYADLSQVSDEELKKVMDKAGADYLLVLNQHYLKWQETPCRTLFHIVSYSLFDRNKQEVTRGNNFFTAINLESPETLRKISRKSTSKIANTVIRSINKD